MKTHTHRPQTHLLVVVPHDVLVVGIRVLRQVPRDQVPRLVRAELEHDVDAVDIAAVEADRVPLLHARIAEGEELVGHLGEAGELRGAGEAEQQEVVDEAVVLGVRGELS